jgi:non-ribosomal peptide synthetase component F
MNANWLQRPALEWEGDAHGEYWEHDALSSWVEVVVVPGSSDAVAAPDRRSHLSYLAVSILTATLANNLRKIVGRKRAAAELSSDMDDESEAPAASVGNPCRSIYIAVAIPEGIMLPLAISAVHALNWQLKAEGEGGCRSNFSAVLIPVDPSDAPRRLEHMLDTCQPTLILTAASCDIERIDAKWRHTTHDVWGMIRPAQGCAREALTRTVLAVGESLDSTSVAWHQWILKCEAALYGVDVAHSIGENRVSHVVFTSGTTGKPKGCVSSIRSLLHYLRAKSDTHCISQHSKVLLASSVSFDPCLGDVLATFSARATLVLPRRCHLVERLFPLLQTFEITHCLCTPTMWGTMSTVAGAGPDAVPCLQVVALGGEAIPPALVQAWGRSRASPEKNRVRLLATYGVTEACVYQTAGEVFRSTAGDARRHSVGNPFDGLYARICNEGDKDTRTDAPIGENGMRVGEVVLYGSQVDEFHGYLHQPNETRAAFVRDETGRVCYRTGTFTSIRPSQHRH